MSTVLKTLAMTALCVAMTACQREAPSEPAAPAPVAAPEPTPTVAAPAQPADTGNTMAVAGVQPTSNAPAWYDAKTFPGTFEAEGIQIELNADGSYRSRIHAASANADMDGDGTWTLEPDGQHILLDSNDKSEGDRRFALVSADTLRADDRGQTLQRVATP